MLAKAEISARVDEIATLGNDVLRQMAVQAGGTNYSLSEIIIDDTTLTVILQ